MSITAGNLLTACKAIKREVVLAFLKARAVPAVRKIRTSSFTCGLVALGESNLYRISPRWITVDKNDADFNIDFVTERRLPFGNESQDVIYSSHTIEHIEEPVLSNLLHESYRILKNGGYIRLEAPDAEVIIAAYKSEDRRILDKLSFKSLVDKGMAEDYGEDHIALLGAFSCYVDGGHHVSVLAPRREVEEKLATMDLDGFGRWCVSLQTEQQRISGGHVNTIYFDKLRSLLAEAGFVDIQQMSNRRTKIPRINLSGIERRQRADFSLYVEARKTF